jgi:protein-glutamine gamma-glutamyltransferase
MKTPPWLMAAALLFWGWETGLLAFAAPLAVALEWARYTRTRWELSNTDLNRIADLCWALFLGAALLRYSIEERLVFIFKLTQWLPFCFFPIMLAQAYGNRPTMPLGVFWWLLRRAPNSPAARKSYNISFCYFACCLLAASAATQPNAFFYPGVTLLVALALSSARPRRVTLAAWVTLLLLVATAGQFGHRELRQAQNAMEIALGSWIAGLFGTQQDIREQPTMIGHSGPIPQSGRIVLRLYPEPGGFAPQLLREAVWDAYRKETWSASNNEPTLANPGSSDTIKFLPTNKLSSEIRIARFYPNGAGMLALPHGTFEIEDVQADVSTNRLGVARIDKGLGLMIFQADFGPGKTFDSPPCARDTMVPLSEDPALAQVVQQLKLTGMSDRQKIRAIYQYFSKNFTYSLNPPRRRLSPQQTWLSYFLLSSRAGHCEYFATATVLLLREAGIPARYVTGYGIPESARHGDTYLVRERDAHAWALAYHSDPPGWEQVDTTPADWSKGAATRPPWWEPAYDAMSNLYFQFSKWRWSKTSFARYTSWLLVPLILYLIGRIALNQRRQRPADGAGDAAAPGWPGLDSELYLINHRLMEAQLARLPNEPLQSWQQRLEQSLPDADRLRRIFHLHRSLRFDPRGLRPHDRETLRSEAHRWMEDFTARMAARKPEPQ